MNKIIWMFILTLLSITTFGGIKKTMVSNNLIIALIDVESHGDSTKVGSCGELGILQIRQCVIDDVNNLVEKKETYVLNDALNNNKAKEICRKYLKYWGDNYQKKTGKKPTNEILSKIWNGGPNAWKKTNVTVVSNLNNYWLKVRRKLA